MLEGSRLKIRKEEQLAPVGFMVQIQRDAGHVQFFLGGSALGALQAGRKVSTANLLQKRHLRPAD